MLSTLTRIGFSHAHTAQETRGYYHSNIINITVIVLFSFRFFIDFFFHNKLMWVEKDVSLLYFMHAIIILSCLLVMLCNYFGRLKLSRSATMIIIPSIVLVAIPLVLANNAIFFWYPFTPIALSVITYFLYDVNTEKKLIFCVVGLYALLTFFSNDILELMLGKLPIQSFITERQVVYRTNPLLLYLFINTIMYYAFKQVQKNEMLLLKAKSELEHANAAKDKFFSILSHDLKGSFSSAYSLTKLMNEKFDNLDIKELKQYSEMLQRSCGYSQKLLDSLLEWSRVQSGNLEFKPQSIDVIHTLEETIEIISSTAEEKSIRIINNSDVSSPVDVDPHMFKTIIRNLLSNSIKFTNKNGTVTINSQIANDYLTLSIIDTGVGMSTKTISQLFKIDNKISELGTNNEKGTGLGLLLVKEFTDLHHGQLWVNSKEGKGTQFHIKLPIKNKKQ